MSDDSPLARFVVPLRRWWIVVAAAVVVGLGGAWVTLPEPAREPTPEELADPTITYRATHVLIRNDSSSIAANFELVGLLARQGDVTNRVVDRMGGQVSVADVDAVLLEPNSAIGTLSVTAVQPTPELASELATTFAQELNDVLVARDEEAVQESIVRTTARLASTSERIEALQTQIVILSETSLDRQLLQAELDVLIGQFGQLQNEARALNDRQFDVGVPFDTLQEPSPVSSTASTGSSTFEVPTNTWARFAIAVVAALVLGSAGVMGIDFLDTRIRTRRDAEEAFGLPVIAEVPLVSRAEMKQEPLQARNAPEGPMAEAIRSLRLAVLLAPTWRLSGQTPVSDGSVGSVAPVTDHGEPRTLVVTSALMGEGKSTVVANLATIFAESGQRVLVVDCDFRRPAVHELLSAEPGKSLRDLPDLDGEPLKDLVVPTAIPAVAMVRAANTPGIAPPWFLKHSASIVEQAMELADVVLFDTGPVTLTNEAAALIPSVDTTLIVNRVGKLSKSDARDVVERLARLGANVAGVTLVGSAGTRRYGYYEPVSKPEQQGKVVWP